MFIGNLRGQVFAAVMFFAAFILGPLWQLNFLSSMPGDFVDARLNLFFLENIYKYLLGLSQSLIHLNIFYPYPYVSAFSDNLIGSAPIYLAARLGNARKCFSSLVFIWIFSKLYCCFCFTKSFWSNITGLCIRGDIIYLRIACNRTNGSRTITISFWACISYYLFSSFLNNL
mgnify:CR=1 FL=1